MKHKIMIALMLSIFFIGLVSAASPFLNPLTDKCLIIEHPISEPIISNQDHSFEFHVYNCSDSRPINLSLVSCSFHLYNSSGKDIFYNNNVQTKPPYDYTQLIKDGNLTIGNYAFEMQCNSSTEGGFYTHDFQITPTGTYLELSTAILIIFILLILIIFMSLSIKGVFSADEGWSQIFYICVSYILLFSVFFLLWLLSKNYLYDIPLLESVFWIIWIVLAGLFFPFVIGVSAYILKKQAETLMEGDYVKQGYTREEASEMSKSKRR